MRTSRAPTHASPGIAVWLAVMLLVPLSFGVISIMLGKDINWDLRNYHYYNAFAFLEERASVDIAPAQLQTFYNPLADIPFYWLAQNYPASVSGFVLGFVHGFNFSLIFLIFWRLGTTSKRWLRGLLGMAVATFSCIAPGFLSELGNTMNDNLTSLFVLLTVLLLIGHLQESAAGKGSLGRAQLVAAGLIMGLGVGLKPTIGVFALAAAIGVLAFGGSWRGRLLALAIFASAGVIGTLASSGFWWWDLWSRYGNPLLPYLNNVFKSPVIAPLGFVDRQYAPRHLWEYLTWPLVFSGDSYRVNPLKFVDIRFALLYLIAILWLLLAGFRRLRGTRRGTADASEGLFEARGANFLLLFFAVSFVFWMVQSSIYRYIISLELLVPLCFLLILTSMTKDRRAQVAVALSTAVLVLLVFRPFDWGRISWGQSYFRVDTRAFDPSQKALVVMLGFSPTAYVIPEFPSSYRFVRPESNFIQEDDYGFFKEIKRLIGETTGNMYVLYDRNDAGVDLVTSSARLGLTIQGPSCVELKVNTPDHLEICRADRAPHIP